MPELASMPSRRPRAVSSGTQGRSLNALAGPLIRALHQVDSACMRALSQSFDDDAKMCARLELSMWLPLHRALTSHLDKSPSLGEPARIDVVLADDLLAFVDEVLLWVADVEAGGTRRLARYLAACRQRLGELAAFGGEPRLFRERLHTLERAMPKELENEPRGPQTAPGATSEGTLESHAKAVAALHGHIAHALTLAAPRDNMSLLDSLTA